MSSTVLVGFIVAFLMGLGLGIAMHPKSKKKASRKIAPVAKKKGGGDSAKTLSTCCQLQTPGTALSTLTGDSLEFRFAGAFSERVELEILEDVTPAQFEPESIVCVQFTLEKTRGVFLGTVQELEMGADPGPILKLSRPKSIVTVEERAAYRIMVSSDSGVEVSFSLDGEEQSNRFDATLENISRLGVQLSMHDEKVTLETGTDISLKMSLGDNIVELSSVVRRVRGLNVGIEFRNIVVDGEARIPKELNYIMTELERVWMANRASNA